MIGILDYGMGNLKSVANSLAFLGADAKIIDSVEEFNDISHLIIPGVGAFPKAMNSIRERGLFDVIKEFANTGKPVLGICLGMQLLADKGMEIEETEGLGLIPGTVELMRPNGLRVPHIGWNAVGVKRDLELFEGVKKTADVYFVHSYHYAVADQENIVATTEYGENFVSIVANKRGNVIGTQFHPEKSQKQGLKLLDNFSRMQPC